MPRRRVVAKREVLPDPVFSNETLAKFINHLMQDGKKSVAEKIVYGALTLIAKRKGAASSDKQDEEGGSGAASVALGRKGLVILEQAFDNVKPMVEVKSRRVGGATYQVPVEVPVGRRMALAMRWLVDAAKKRGEKTMMSRLAGEILDAFEGKGAAVKKREETHRMAKANQAFAHFRW